ncbi:hypothetical protein Fmac_003384 [Flemingia macrophylla]|uniref:threonine--tRNA ligase n=1 Tax=Flemingia macrophylla TaxID=520843 RepID=A0ABD1NMM1_9FABA
MLCSLIRLRRYASLHSPLISVNHHFSSAAAAAMVAHAKDEAYLEAAIPKRIRLFETIQAEQRTQRLSLSPEPIKVTLPDGNVKEAKKWLSTPLDVAREISKNLASNALIAKVNGMLWDMTRPLEDHCHLQIFKFDDDEGRDTFWHSSAHILGQSLETEYGCKLCIGPCTTRGEGFYYDAFYGELGLNDDHFKQIEAGALKAVAVEIINDLPPDKTITVYRCGPLVDLCRGPHIPNTSFVKAIACLKASSAYWRGDKDRESLQRVYGISYPDQKSLKEYLHRLEEAKKYDHRILGVKQELILHHEWRQFGKRSPLSPGSWFFLPHGARIYNKLMDFIRNQYRDRGYQEVISPNVFNMDLWVQSGHAANYREDMFILEVDMLKLPLRFADFGVLHRNEASGALSGLTRVRRFQQDDAHIFCRESQIKDEVRKALNFINYVYEIFGFTYELKLSTRPEKYLGDLETWDKAESALKEALDDFGKPWQSHLMTAGLAVHHRSPCLLLYCAALFPNYANCLLLNEGDGAFYGPKIDISVSDALSRKFQCATLQLDFQLPDRFKLEYSAEDEAKIERPVMIHRAILGSVERMFAILLEHYKGKWPFWLSPRQAIVCPVSEKSQSYALQVRDQIHQAGYHVDADTTDRKIQKKVREAQLAQYNYILVVGEEETNTGQVSVRVRDKADHKVMSIENLLKHFRDEIAAFH